MPASKYVRPARPRAGLHLQPRDRALLAALHDHRFMRAEHLHLLLFAEVSAQMVRRRLRLLWEHELVDRFFVPFVLDGVHAPPPTAATPIYAVAPAGQAIVAEDRGLEVDDLPDVPRENQATTLAHDLVVTDLFVALAVACRGRDDLVLVSIEHEGILRQRFGRAGECRQLVRGIVPDGAFTLFYPHLSERRTFYIETVRANVRGGNHHLRDKLERYTRLHHDGWFRSVYGHEHLRAVIVLTTSTARTGHFVELARQLRHGRRLFWFDAYQAANDQHVVSTLTAGRILDARWQTATGERLSFIVPPPASDDAASA